MNCGPIPPNFKLQQVYLSHAHSYYNIDDLDFRGESVKLYFPVIKSEPKSFKKEYLLSDLVEKA